MVGVSFSFRAPHAARSRIGGGVAPPPSAAAAVMGAAAVAAGASSTGGAPPSRTRCTFASATPGGRSSS